MSKANRQTVIFKTVYYLLTLLSLGAFAWALCSAYLRTDISLVYWGLIAFLFAIYFVLAVVSIRRRWGFNRFVVHVFMLQLIPVLVAITVFSILPDVEVEEKVATTVECVAEDDTTTPNPYKERPAEPLTGRPRDYERAFNDMQDKQKAAAIANGLATFASREDVESKYATLKEEGKLVKISTNENYIVRELTDSSPYVIPKMAKLLDDIAALFQWASQSNAKFVVTSVLRTEEDIENLRKKNGNASADSCHCNATTVDISYVRFGQEDDNEQEDYLLRLALAKTMHELRKEGRCYVKIERKQYCYHITVR